MNFNPNAQNAVVLLSGGLDSTTALAVAQNRFRNITALSVNYGQRHARELRAAHRVAEFFNVPHYVLDLTSVGQLFQSNNASSSLLYGQDVPDGHYAEDNMKKTIVPNRNMILLSIAAGLVVSKGGGAVVVAAHAGDHFIYPDCRPEFLHAVEEALQIGNDEPVGLYAPFKNDSKAAIVSIGHALDVPYHLTWSCYKGGDVHCGRCGTCVERIEAFRLAGVPDPTVYDTAGYAYALELLKAKEG